jgi:hypothetical protein
MLINTLYIYYKSTTYEIILFSFEKIIKKDLEFTKKAVPLHP